ncbi:hypothetical protein NEOLEDRAFT_1133654 [Neolentinus lepideus HHB14362 ss-1]|uniref:Secreted protein n=1 Tax=Neolentinus lepideus HHB14362 ss-1 TaxID=1314782 RepID=A0A165SKG2_9AGAM|nr:hypothetical protein NEOLEDRAFT_1133654 [Neolentinus lepideus HHB14362 ss-1]
MQRLSCLLVCLSFAVGRDPWTSSASSMKIVRNSARHKPLFGIDDPSGHEVLDVFEWFFWNNQRHEPGILTRQLIDLLRVAWSWY